MALTKLTIAVLIGLLAFFFDLARQNPLYGISIHFWDFFILFSAVFLGPISAACTGLTLGLLFIFDLHNIDYIGWTHVLLFMAEGFFVGALRYQKKPLRPVQSAVLYWFLIGTPGYMLLFSPVLESSAMAYVLDTLRFAGSGVCSALIVQLICFSPKVSSALDLFGYRKDSQREWPVAIIFDMYLVSLIVIPLLIWLQYSMVVADNAMEKYLKNEISFTIDRIDASITRETELSFNLTHFLQEQYIGGGSSFFKDVANAVVPDHPEIIAIQIEDHENSVTANFGSTELFPELQENIILDTYKGSAGNQFIAIHNDSLAVLKQSWPELSLESHTLLDITKFAVISDYVTPNERSIALRRSSVDHYEQEPTPGVNSPLIRPLGYWETRSESSIPLVSHLDSRLRTTAHYSKQLTGFKHYEVVNSISLREMVDATVQAQLLTCLWGLIYILCAYYTLRLTTRKAILRFTDLSRATNAWSAKKAGLLDIQHGSSVMEFNALTISLEKLVESFVDEQERTSEAQQDLRTHSNWLDSIFGSFSGHILVFDKNGILKMHNETAKSLSHTVKVEATSESIVAGMILEWQFETARKAFLDALAGKSTEGKEVFVTLTTGKRRALLMSWSPLRNLDSIDGVIVVAQDITEKIESYNALVHASKLATLGEMATGIAHEINQPLNIIRMAVENVELAHQRGVLTDELLEEKIARVTSQIDRAGGIVNHIRSFGRKSLRERVPVNVSECTSAIVALMKEQLMLDGINVTHLDELGSCVALGDKIQLEQILINLISNARDAINENSILNGEVSVEVVQGDGHAVLKVRDNGGGIPEHALKNLFEPFFTTKPADSGTGLGLSVTHSIVSDMGGSIDASNEEGGALFVVTFPAIGETQVSSGLSGL
ncbi:MAG: ATP-binding protein [Halioglobus sp.]